MNLHLYFLDDYSQNAATTFEYIKNFIHWMQENKLFIKNGIIYDTTDVCSTKYICADAMWILLVLELTYIVIIDRLTNYPGHGEKQNIWY